jgi:hypothetical protein
VAVLFGLNAPHAPSAGRFLGFRSD